MREPGRLQISWQDDNTLKIETDAGTQTRLLRFAAPNTSAPPAAGEPTWQGTSIARWEAPPRGLAGNTIPLGLGSRAGTDSRTLEVVTTRIRPGYLRKNGVPFSADATVTEYFDLFKDPDGVDWFVVTIDRARPAVPQRPVGDDESLQERARRREVEADTVRGPLSPEVDRRA